MTSPIAPLSVSSTLSWPTAPPATTDTNTTTTSGSAPAKPTFTTAEQSAAIGYTRDSLLLSSMTTTTPTGAGPLYGSDSVTLSSDAFTAAVHYDMYTSSGATTGLIQWLSTGAIATPSNNSTSTDTTDNSATTPTG